MAAAAAVPVVELLVRIVLLLTSCHTTVGKTTAPLTWGPQIVGDVVLSTNINQK